MEDRERVLYQIMGALHKVGAPLIFTLSQNTCSKNQYKSRCKEILP